MTQSQKIIFSLTLVILAGLWGYAGDSLLSSTKDKISEVTEELGKESIPEPSRSESDNAPPLLPQQPKDQAAKSFPKATPAPASRSDGNTNTIYSPPANPYEAMNRATSLNNTLESITPGETRPRSNAYFDKLSEQLRELQGENPPQAGSPNIVEAAEKDEALNDSLPERTPQEVDDDETSYSNDTVEELDKLLEDDQLVDELEQILIEEGY